VTIRRFPSKSEYLNVIAMDGLPSFLMATTTISTTLIPREFVGRPTSARNVSRHPLWRFRVIYLKLSRLARGLTQKTIGQAADVPQPVVGLIETGRRNPTAAERERLSRCSVSRRPFCSERSW